jgi:hypothetical protein
MSNLNDNNLDDLLRRAAEKYPLRTDSADFDKLVSDLDRDPSLILPPVMEDKQRRRRFLWLFFLLPLAGGAYYAWHAGRGRQMEVVEMVKGKEVVKGNNELIGNEGDKKSKGDEVVNGVVDDNKEPSGNGGGNEVVKGYDGVDNKDIKRKSNNKLSGKDVVKTDDVIDEHKHKKNVKEHGEDDQIRNGRGSDAVKENSGGNEIVKKNGGEDRKDVKGNVDLTGNEGNNNGKKKSNGDQIVNDAIVDNKHKKDTRDLKEKTDLIRGDISLAPTKGAVTVNIPVKANTPEAAVKTAPAKDKIKLQKPKPSFYVGILASPDLSVVRFQSVKSVGDNVGLLFGYNFNSRWAIETGIYYDRKKYYTNGEYFSKSKVPRLDYVDLKTVDGVCNMWEIPLNVRYNFSTGRRMKWFATAGLSTYLMSKETYTFVGTYGSNPNWHGTWPYDTPYKYWFSILNLSAGFEQRLGGIGNLRLEPFLRVPLSGIGTGSLSIMSAGLNIGITRRIW